MGTYLCVACWGGGAAALVQREGASSLGGDGWDEAETSYARLVFSSNHQKHEWIWDRGSLYQFDPSASAQPSENLIDISSCR